MKREQLIVYLVNNLYRVKCTKEEMERELRKLDKQSLVNLYNECKEE